MMTSHVCHSPVISVKTQERGGLYNHHRFPLFTFQWQIGLGDTLCYRFRSSGSSNGESRGQTPLERSAPEEKPSSRGLRGSIQVTFKSLKSVYSVVNSYYFKLARSNVNCVCDCPGGGNACNTYTDR